VSALLAPFLSPWALGLAALLPVIVILYLLKLKRRPQIVASTLLWRRSVQDMIANAPFQRLRNNLLMWLQLLALLLLVLALARPVAKVTGMGGETIIVLLDRSASMQTREADGETRFDKAKALAEKAVEGIGGGGGILPGLLQRDEMMLIGFADTPVPLQPMTEDRAALLSAIRSARPMDTEANLTDLGYILQERTMRIKDGAIEPNPNARVILISDGVVGPTISSLADVINVDFTSVGDATDNVGFTGVDVRESFAGQYEYQVFATLLNSGADATSVFVELQVDAEVLDLKKVDIPANQSAAVVFTVGEAVRGLATLRLTDHTDAYALDDMVRAVVSPPTDLKVLIVSKGNSFIERAFSVDPRVSITRMRPDEYTPRGEYDITVFDDCTTAEIPAGNFLFINSLPPADVGYTKKAEEIDNPRIIDWSRVHPVTRYANFQRVLIGKSLSIEPPPAATPLLQAVETDLISIHETETRRVIVIGFDVNLSYWPVDVSFPIFFANLIDYWARTGRGLGKPAYATGETVPIVPPRDAAKATVTLPDASKIEYDLAGQTTIYLTETQAAGIYTVSFDKGTPRQIPINAMSILESHIAPVRELEIGGRKIVASKEAVKTRQEIWFWLALAALAILMAEWAIYCRRTFM